MTTKIAKRPTSWSDEVPSIVTLKLFVAFEWLFGWQRVCTMQLNCTECCWFERILTLVKDSTSPLCLHANSEMSLIWKGTRAVSLKIALSVLPGPNRTSSAFSLLVTSACYNSGWQVTYEVFSSYLKKSVFVATNSVVSSSPGRICRYRICSIVSRCL